MAGQNHCGFGGSRVRRERGAHHPHWEESGGRDGGAVGRAEGEGAGRPALRGAPAPPPPPLNKLFFLFKLRPALQAAAAAAVRRKRWPARRSAETPTPGLVRSVDRQALAPGPAPASAPSFPGRMARGGGRRRR